MRALVLAVQGGESRVVERNPLAHVLERGPHNVLNAGGLGGARHRGSLLALTVAVAVLPEIRHAKGAMGTGERRRERLGLVGVGGDHLGAESGERLGFVGVGVARDRAGGEGSVLVGENGADQPAPLCASGSEYRDDLLAGHYCPIGE